MSRVDKFLWSVRIYKTRTDATEACRSGRIKVNGLDAKPSREVKPGNILNIRKGSIHFQYKVIADVERRQPARMVEEYILNITPKEELEKLNMPRETFFLARDRGTGRPTKKERRDMDDLLDSVDFLYDTGEDED
ncbi:Heat shock protein 15 [Bacteroidales bacterium CF]|jgi:Ribosome-associated heat shock protein implicated in the recycling of the 50S subunit (S4 paralog)|nr:Heat shock protein 15 [Bacteroidales bacterium CF]